MSNAIQALVNKDQQDLKNRVEELKTLCRIIANTQNLIADAPIIGSHAKAVYEIQNWLDSFFQGVQAQLDTLEKQLPAETASGNTEPSAPTEVVS